MEAGVLTVRHDDRDAQIATLEARLHQSERERRASERDLRMLAAQLRRQARTDPLTGLENRRSFDTALQAEWARARRGTIGTQLVVADIDGFKAVNDKHGHAAGDQALCVVAGALAPARGTDVVARLGGDEFGVILSGCADPREAQGFCDRAVMRLEELADGLTFGIRLSFGHHPLGESASPHDALAAADLAMYAARRERRGC